MLRLLLSTFLASALLAGGTATARDRYVTPPPVVLSPDLSSKWTLQLRAAPQAERPQAVVRSGVVRRSSKTRYKPLARVTAPRARRTRPVVRAALRPTLRPAPRPASRPSIDTSLLPTSVAWHGNERPGTIIVDTPQRRLFLVQSNGRARRYAVGVGKPGFEWAGRHKITRKAQWPSWRPPAEMIARERRKGRTLPAFMEGGPDNPLGARALYLGSSIYRIHGTNQDWSIGKAVSSGCIRMRNEDVMDLYRRVGVGTLVKVI